MKGIPKNKILYYCWYKSNMKSKFLFYYGIMSKDYKNRKKGLIFHNICETTLGIFNLSQRLCSQGNASLTFWIFIR